MSKKKITKSSRFSQNSESKRVNVIPSLPPTPSVTPTISVSNSIKPSPSISLTPSKTPSLTPTVTPSITNKGYIYTGDGGGNPGYARNTLYFYKANVSICTKSRCQQSSNQIEVASVDPLNVGLYYREIGDNPGGLATRVYQIVTQTPVNNANIILTLPAYTSCELACGLINPPDVSPSSTPTPTPTPNNDVIVDPNPTSCKECQTLPLPYSGNGTFSYLDTTVTTSYTGPGPIISNENTDSCTRVNYGYTINVGHILGNFTYTITFSKPVNNIKFRWRGGGSQNDPGQEESYKFMTNSGIPTLSFCGTTCGSNRIAGNILYTAYSRQQGLQGGGVFQVNSPTPYTSITITDNNLLSSTPPNTLLGIGLWLCLSSISPILPSLTPTPTLTPTPSPNACPIRLDVAPSSPPLVCYPCIRPFILGEGTGTVSGFVSANSIPDRFIIRCNGQILYDSGYIGSDYYNGVNGRLDIAAFMNGKTDPVTGLTYPNTAIPNTLNDGYPRVTYVPYTAPYYFSFIKASYPSSTCTLEVYSLVSNTSDGFKAAIDCQILNCSPTVVNLSPSNCAYCTYIPLPKTGNGSFSYSDIVINTSYTGPTISSFDPASHLPDCIDNFMFDGSIILNNTVPITYTINFSKPINNVKLRYNSSYIDVSNNTTFGPIVFNTNTGVPTLSLCDKSCETNIINGNSLYLNGRTIPSPGTNQDSYAGGILQINRPSPYTSITITISDQIPRSFLLLDLCLTKGCPVNPSPSPTPTITPTITPSLSVGACLNTNGTFNTNLNGWTLPNNAWVWNSSNGGVASYINGDEGGCISQNILTIGQTYRITLDVFAPDLGAGCPPDQKRIIVRAGNTMSSFYYTVGTYSIDVTLTCTGTTTFCIEGYQGCSNIGQDDRLYIDNVCVRPV